MDTKERLTIKDRLRRLWRMNNAPQDISLGVAIGAFISILPVYGLHTILALGAAFAIKRVNKIAVLLGTNVSTFVTFPFITWIAYDIGRMIMHNGYPPLTWHAFRTFSYRTLLDIYYPLFIGSVILGLVVGCLFYFLTLWFVKWRRKVHARTASLKINIVIFAVVVCLSADSAGAQDHTGEKISYGISTGGSAEYTDLGIVDFNGRKARKVTFKTHIGGLLDDLEVIYSIADSPLPLRIERDVKYLFRKERLIEEYTPETSSVIIKKYLRDKFVKEYRFSSESPIQNPILLPFYIRTVADLKVGWSFDVNIPRRFKVTLVDIVEAEVPAGKFMSFHFTSEPRKFEIWITRDADRVPIMIEGASGYKYTLVMKARSSSALLSH
jgi:uncharacterized protein